MSWGRGAEGIVKPGKNSQAEKIIKRMIVKTEKNI